MRQSSLPCTGSVTELLISIVKARYGTTYLAGGGAAGCQDDALFAAKDVERVYHCFSPAPYGDADRWLPGLSIIDHLMHGGRHLAETSSAS